MPHRDLDATSLLQLKDQGHARDRRSALSVLELLEWLTDRAVRNALDKAARYPGDPIVRLFSSIASFQLLLEEHTAKLAAGVSLSPGSP